MKDDPSTKFMVRPMIMIFPHTPSKQSAEDLRLIAKDLHNMANQYDPKDNIVRIVK